MKIISVQRANLELALVQISDQRTKEKHSFYCPYDIVGEIVKCNINMKL